MKGTISLSMRWLGGERFDIRVGDHDLRLDGESLQGVSPMQYLACGVAGCMAIDVAHILTRMRTPPDALVVAMDTERPEEPPRRFTRLTLTFELTGEIPEANVERAVRLSRETYCSAWNSLREDTELVVHTRIIPPPPA